MQATKRYEELREEANEKLKRKEEEKCVPFNESEIVSTCNVLTSSQKECRL